MTDLETFRTETRAWLEANCPPEMRQPVKGDEDICWGGRNWVFSSPAQKQWLEVMAAKGWTVPDWPVAYGGGGLSPEETKVLRQEMAKLGCRSPLNSFGIWMLGPALLKFGTEEQKLHYLPQIARGEIRWCQGYSEPGSGSDLVSLQTFGEDKGDHWVVNGQKIWTSYADKADWIFCLVRTNKEDKYHGISFLLFDMTTPGVSTKPILLISGAVGVFRGFIRESIALLAWLVGLWVAWHFAYLVNPWLGGALAEPGVREWTGRGIVLLLVLLAGSLVGSVVSHHARRAVGLAAMDRLLGAVFGLVRGAVIIGLIVLAGRAAGDGRRGV